LAAARGMKSGMDAVAILSIVAGKMSRGWVGNPTLSAEG
jgi:hypothetical protein